MSSTNTLGSVDAARNDARHIILEHISVDGISPEDARLLMSEEHKILGYRPPPHSLASQAQSAVSRNDWKRSADLSLEQIRVAALEDAAKIRDEHMEISIDLDKICERDARILMSEEHKALGYRPPAGSLAAQAQRRSVKKAAKYSGDLDLDLEVLKKAARVDAEKIENERSI